MWAWDRGRPLLKTPIPPFIFGRGRYDNWLTHVAINEDSRPVVDISEAVTAVHIMHNHSLLRTTERTIEQAPDSPAAEFWSSDIRNKFELYINAYLAERHGDFRAQQGTPLHAQLKLGSCYENEGLCVLHRKRPASCRCEQAPFVRATSSDPFVVNDSRLIMCGLLSENFGTQSTKMRWHITGEQEEGRSSAFGLPLMQTDLLPMIGKDTYVVFLMVAEYADRRLVMETVCSMRAHGVFDWLLVAALDDEMYRYCAARGIAVYLSEFDESNTKSHESFRQLARYQVMHEIMRHGKDVFSLSPGIIFVDTPWAYFETLKDADMAFVGEKLGPVAGRAESSIPTPLVYGRNVSVTFQVLKNVISFMQHNSLQDGHLFVSTFCGNKNERILKNNSCRATGGANAQLFDINKVQPLDGCENCSARSKPIMYYVSGASSKSFSREEVLAVLEKHGMVRFLEDQERCSYDPPFS